MTNFRIPFSPCMRIVPMGQAGAFVKNKKQSLN